MGQKAPDDDLVMSLVEMALARPKDERAAYLRQACEGDSALFALAWNYVEAEDQMAGFLADPLYTPPSSEQPFEAGELLIGRFRIIREIARGGMGVVYEAHDERLDRRIALKCARSAFRQRLPPEVRLASEISHPNVCKIFEIHTAPSPRGDVDFFTMELLRGETLIERVQRKPLTEPEARKVALQLCDGLSAAHRNGVVHGDLKGNNIILTTEADGSIRAVITDFGLARPVTVRPATVQTYAVQGTPDYMAPELWGGAKPSVASDVYALGIILHELIAGKRPSSYRGELLTPKLPAVHPRWDPIIRRCIERDPKRRFASAEEIARAFAPSMARRRVIGIAAAAVLAVTSGVVSYRTATAPSQRVVLAMLPLEAPGDTGAVGTALSRDAAAGISHIRSSARTDFRFIPLLDSLRRQADTPEKVREVFGATHVLHGRLERADGRLRLHASIEDVRTGTLTREWTGTYAQNEIRYVPMALAGVVTNIFRLPALTAAATVNAAALQDYTSGMAYVRRNSGVDLALPLLERAVAADPDSPLTHAGLAEAQWLKFRVSRDRFWLSRATESWQQAERRNPDLAEVHRIAGMMQLNSSRYEQAVSDFQRAIELQPSNADAYRRLGAVYDSTNQLSEAEAAHRRAIELDPSDYRNHQALGNYFKQHANYTEAARHFRKATEVAPDEPIAHFALATAYLNLGQFSEAEAELRYSLRLGETAEALHTLGIVLMYQGKDQEAVSWISRAVGRFGDNPLWWINLGTVYRRLNMAADSERALRRGRERAEIEVVNDPRNGYLRACLAYLCARLGDRGRAEAEVAQSLQLSTQDHDARWWAVSTYEALGRREDSLAVLRASVPAQLGDVSRYPDLADLRKDPRFIQMLGANSVTKEKNE